MRIGPATMVKCNDGNEYVITERTTDNYMMGMSIKLGSSPSSQRLFKPNGHYAGSNKERNVAEIL